MQRDRKRALNRDTLHYCVHEQVQRRTIFWVAATYALHFTGKMMVGMNKAMEAEVVAAGSGAMIGAVHAIGTCLKAVTTTLSCDGIEELRRTCGGYGYSSFSGLESILGQALLQYTGEGENMMIIQQAARALLKLYHASTVRRHCHADTKFVRARHWTACAFGQ
eukprot:m.842628 g.842628  ORF g.842628 m.842628 type:complete len:164 (+) comp23470_c1_seq75:1835-2326(+)